MSRRRRYPRGAREMRGAPATFSGATLLVSEYPPGRPLNFTVTLPSGALALQAKAQGSKRREDGQFEVRVKLTSLRREARETLTQAFAAAAAPDR